jgi:hypothetical protein
VDAAPASEPSSFGNYSGKRMGAWGVAVFSDDLAADVRDEFRDLIGEGLSPSQAVNKLLTEYASSLDDDDEMSIFWIALASTQWKLGRLEHRTKQEALRVINSGQDLKRWDSPRYREKRAAVLAKVRKQLLSPQPGPKRVRRTVKEANDWSVGEVLGLQLRSGKWTLMRVIGHHKDRGGRFAVCELLRWVGKEIPRAERISKLPVNKQSTRDGISQFLFQAPRKKQDQGRVRRLGIASTPAQKCGGYTVLVWPYVDRLLERLFGLK